MRLSLPHKTNGRKWADQGPATPKGCIAVRVGEGRERFYVPVGHLNHPLFARLLKEAEEEFGFEQEGAITIPCHVEYFLQVSGLIDRESGLGSSDHFHHHHHHHLLPLSGCFRA